jgi:hypothetical protein
MTVCPRRQSFPFAAPELNKKNPGVVFSIDWGHFPRLRFIQLEIFQDNPAVKQVLSQIVSLHMQEVAFIYSVKNNDGLDGDLWLELDAILARPQFSGLRRVSISPSPAPPFASYYVADHKWFVRHLPQCHARGILFPIDSKWSASLFDAV